MTVYITGLYSFQVNSFQVTYRTKGHFSYCTLAACQNG